MTRPRLEVADVIPAQGDTFRDAYGDTLSPAPRRALIARARGRTAAQGGHVEEGDRWGHRQVASNSCRNRHCPPCQATEAARWVEARAAELLPRAYFQGVFTLPAALGPIALPTPGVVDGLLFRAAGEPLLQIAADPRPRGAEIGFLAVLPPGGQHLQHHPQGPGVVAGGGLSFDDSPWVSCPRGCLFPVRVLSRVCRDKCRALLRAAFDQGRLACRGMRSARAAGNRFHQLLAARAQTAWVVYAQPPFGGPEQVLTSLARSTHRVAISHRRLVGLNDGRVCFRGKDDARGGKRPPMTLPATEFLGRFLLQGLPPGFARIRPDGFLGNRHRREKGALGREMLNATAPPEAASPSAAAGLRVAVTTTRGGTRCPACGVGRRVVVAELPPPPRGGGRGERPLGCAVIDTS